MTFIKPGNRIYHYCSLTTALEFVLPHFQLLLAPIQKTNDPRENKSFYFKHRYNIHTNPIDINLRKLDKEISETIREGCKVLCFCQDNKIYWGSLLSKMWAHYGGNHQGVCLEIDKAKFIKENSTSFDFNLFKPINYFEFDHTKPPEHKTIDHAFFKTIGREKYLREQFRKQHIDYLFFTKNREWESECEIRLLHFSDKSENEYCSIKSSLRNIHLGINFHNSYLPAIKDLIRQTDIEIVATDYGDNGLIFKTL